jgi:enoyl-CoA hydratase/carnithine racemase
VTAVDRRSPGLRTRVEGAVATLTISNPSRRNAMTRDMWTRLPTTLATLATDAAVRVVVLQGAQDHFCAGADVGEFLSADDDSSDTRSVVAAAEHALIAFPKPLIAAIRGYCIGGGCQIAAATDLRIASDDAVLAVPPARLGIVYPASSVRRLVTLVGPGVAKRLLFTGARLTAQEALQVSLVEEVVPAAQLDERVHALSTSIAALSQLSIRASKEMVDAIAAGHGAQHIEDRWIADVAAGAEIAEGIRSFTERRPADFPWARHP